MLYFHADVAQAIMSNLDQLQAGGQAYNVADGTPVPISEIRQLDGWAEPTNATDSEVDDPWEAIVDTTKIKDELGFHPMHPSIHAAEKTKAM